MLPALLSLPWLLCCVSWLLRTRRRAKAKEEALREVENAFRKAQGHFAEAARLSAASQAALEGERSALAKAFADKQHHAAEINGVQEALEIGRVPR